MRRTLVILCLAPCLLAAAKRPLTIDDTLEMVRLDDVLISPDGERVFYSERHLDWDENKFIKKFFMVSSNGGDAVEFVKKDGGERFLFSPDGKDLSFLRPVEENAKKTKPIFLMSLSGGEARQHAGGGYADVAPGPAVESHSGTARDAVAARSGSVHKHRRAGVRGARGLRRCAQAIGHERDEAWPR